MPRKTTAPVIAAAAVAAAPVPRPPDALLLSERIDVEAGKRVVRSAAYARAKAADPSWPDYAGLVAVAEELGDCVPVQYTRGQFGRYVGRVRVTGHGTDLPSASRMKREVRAHLAAAHYLDLDMVNAHPTIMLQTLQQQGLAASAPCLSRYVHDREECLAEVVDACAGRVTRADVKELFISIMFFGGVGAWETKMGLPGCLVPNFPYQMAAELVKVSTELLKSPTFAELLEFSAEREQERLRTDNHVNRLGMRMGVLLQDLERQCLDALRLVVTRSGRTVGALIHDGMHIQKCRPDEVGIPRETLDAWQSEVKVKTSYDLRLDVKPFAPDPAWLAPEGEHIVGLPDTAWLREDGILMTHKEMKRRWELFAFKVIFDGVWATQAGPCLTLFSRAKLHDSFDFLKYFTLERESDTAPPKVTMHPFMGTRTGWTHDPTARRYDNMDVRPPPLEASAGTYNLWEDFEAALYRPTRPVDPDSEGVRALRAFTLGLLGEEAARYWERWVAQAFQQPGIKSGVAVVLFGSEGTGKNTLCDLVGRMMGDAKVMETSDPANKLCGRFNDARLNKFLVVLNEADPKVCHASSDQLKDMITARDFMMEGKGQPIVKRSCFARLVFTTNNENAVKVGPDSRRYVVMETTEAFKQDRAFFGGLARHVHDPHVRHEYWAYLTSLDLAGADWERERPMGQHHRAMARANLDKVHEFLCREVVAAVHAGRPVLRYQAARLLERLDDWLVAGRFAYPVNATTLGTKLSPLLRGGGQALEGLSKSYTDGKTFYTLDVPLVAAAMVARRWLDRDELVVAAAPPPEFRAHGGGYPEGAGEDDAPAV
jgi:hypothetical protein